MYTTKHLIDKLEFAKVTAALSCVFPDAANRPSRKEWYNQFRNPSLAEPLGVSRAIDDANISSAVSRMTNGTRPPDIGRLVALAKYTRLAGFLGGAEEAAHCLTDDLTYEDFCARVLSSGWADHSSPEKALYALRHRLLQYFREFTFTREGMRVGADIVVMAAKPDIDRGTRLPTPEDLEVDLPPITAESKIKVRLDIQSSCALILLEIGPDGDEDYEVRCLAPSPLVQNQMIHATDRVLPTHSVNGVRAYIASEALGRHDWLAILTPRPIELPWTFRSDALVAVQRPQLHALLSALRAAHSGGNPVEVRQYSFRVVSG